MNKNIHDSIRNLLLATVAIFFIQGCWSSINFSIEKFAPKDSRPLLLIPNLQPSIPPLQKNSLDYSKPNWTQN